MTPPYPPWGWTDHVRIALAAVAGALALGLLATTPGDRSSMPEPPDLVVDPNTAPPGVLEALPRIGPSRRSAILAERARAPFQSLDDLERRVRGIGPETLADLKPYLRVGPPAGPLPHP